MPAALDTLESVMLGGEAHELSAAAVQSWALLLTAAPPDVVSARGRLCVGRVGDAGWLTGRRGAALLDVLENTQHAGLTLAIGTAYSVLYELLPDLDVDDAIALFDALATEVNKHKAGARRCWRPFMCGRPRRSSRRSMPRSARPCSGSRRARACAAWHSSAQGGEMAAEKLTVHKEKIELDTWGSRHLLAVLRSVLLGGLDAHVHGNALVRAMLDLGDAPGAARRRRLADKVARQSTVSRDSLAATGGAEAGTRSQGAARGGQPGQRSPAQGQRAAARRRRVAQLYICMQSNHLSRAAGLPVIVKVVELPRVSR